MAEIVLYHHAQGLTPGVVAFADALRAAGHTVHTPDLYDGHTFATLDEGLDYARSRGFGALAERGVAAAADFDGHIVVAGISLGAMPAQQLAQTRPVGAALLISAALPPSEFGDGWPSAVPVQVHGMAADPEFADSGDLDAARELVASATQGELFLYPGSAHLFLDSSLPDHDPDAAGLLGERVLAFLDRVA